MSRRLGIRPRLTWTIFTAAAFGSTSLFAAYTVAPLIASDLLDSHALSGAPGASIILGTALGSLAIAGIMARRGRRAGLLVGWIAGAAGAALAIAAANAGQIAFLLVALLLVGVGHSSNQLSRFAAADMYASDRKGSVLGWIVWAGTIGAVAGPSLLRPAERVAETLGVTSLSAGLIVGVIGYVLAACAAATLRPDPKALASDGDAEETEQQPRMPLPARDVQLALGALVAAQVVMTAVMTFTPVHLREAGHGLGAVGAVMSAHLVGMFALAPVMGKVVDRVGHTPVLVTGSLLLLGAATSAASSTGSHAGRLAGSLLLLGLGWSSVFVAGSTLLTGGLGYATRARLQGRVDTAVWTASAVASLAAGFVVEALGWTALCLGAATIALATVVAIVAKPVARPRVAGGP